MTDGDGPGTGVAGHGLGQPTRAVAGAGAPPVLGDPRPGSGRNGRRSHGLARDPPAHRRPRQPASGGPAGGGPASAWAELHCHSSYSFLDGASAPAELVAEAARPRPRPALAITDHDGMYGVPPVRAGGRPAHESRLGAPGSARLRRRSSASTFRNAPGQGLPDPAGQHLLVLARDPEGYRRLCQVISAAQLAGARRAAPSTTWSPLAPGARRALGDPHRLPQGRRPRGARLGRPSGRPRRSSRRWPPCSARRTSWSS